MKRFLFLAAALMMTNAAFAQENNEGDKVEISPAMQTLEMAGNLVQYGYDNYSATALAQAVELYNSVTVKLENIKKTSEGGVDTPKDQRINLDVNALLADARNFADGDEVTLAYIDKVEDATNASNATLGRYDGPSETEECVLSNSIDTYRVLFRGREDAGVLVVGDGDTDLDLYIYDENGNLVDSNTDSTDVCVCSWRPYETSYYTIKIRNWGNVRNYYTMYIP